jgi:hypothetical protein
MYYELWDLRTRNLVNEFDTEVEALSYVREVLEKHGEEPAAGYALGVQNLEAGGGAAIADGAALLHRAVGEHPLARLT